MMLGKTNEFNTRKTVFVGNILKLEISATCNATCVFCPMFHNPRKKKGFLTYEDIVSFIDINGYYLRESDFEIEPFFNGESLLHTRFLEMMELIANEGLRLGELDTNFSIRLDIPRLAALPLRRLTVNIGGLDQETNALVMGTDLERVLRNVKLLMENNLRTYEVCLKMNPVRTNLHQVELFDNFVRSLHSELHWKSQKTGLPVPTDLSSDERTEYLREVYSSERPDLFRFRLMENGNDLEQLNNHCLYMTPCINTDGSVTICAHDQLRHFNFGNAFRDRLQDIFVSDEYQFAIQTGRQRGLEICRGCN